VSIILIALEADLSKLAHFVSQVNIDLCNGPSETNSR